MKHLPLFAAALLLSANVLAADADQVSVNNPYIRLAPPNAPATAAFMVLQNAGAKDVKLVKADNPATRVTELHTHLNEGGVMKMRPVPAIEIKAGGETALQPGGLHVMMIEPKAPMKEGDVVPLNLTFGDGSSKRVEVKVTRTAPGSVPMMEHKH